MKFHWFAEVTYPHLPDGFAERFEGGWVDFPRRYYDPVLGARVYDDYLDEYVYADEVGFDGIAVNEHHQYMGAVTPSPNLFAAILARQTRQAALVVLGNSIALYNPPVRVAEEMAMLDVLSRGRLVAGLVVGTPMDAVFCYGVPAGELRERWREAHDLILAAWAAEEPFAFDGKYTRLPHVNVWPRLLQTPRPPIWVPGLTSLETWELTAELGYCYGHFSFSGLAKARAFVDGYWRFVEQTGADDNPYRFALAQVICVSESDAAAEREYGRAVEFFFHHVTRSSPRFAAPPGYQSERSRAHFAALAEGIPAGKTTKPSQEMRFADYVESGAVIAGSPETVRARLHALATELRVGQLVCLLQMGDLGKEATLRNTRLFATEVMPHLRGLHSGYEDHWTPRRAAAGEPRP